jgi:hypothetical protein
MENIEKEFQKRRPWVTQFTISGKKYGGKIFFENDPRIKQIFDSFPDVHSILELGSLEGGQSFQLAKQPGVHVLAVEGRQNNIEKAKFVQQLLGIKNVEFIQVNLENTELSTFGQFDGVFCSGLLYHLYEPWKLIKEIGNISQRLFIWTHYAAEDKANEIVKGFRGFWYQEGGTQDSLSGLSPKSFWLTLPSLKELLNQEKFIKVKVIEDNPHHPNGPCITMVAMKK